MFQNKYENVGSVLHKCGTGITSPGDHSARDQSTVSTYHTVVSSFTMATEIIALPVAVFDRPKDQLIRESDAYFLKSSEL